MIQQSQPESHLPQIQIQAAPDNVQKDAILTVHNIFDGRQIGFNDLPPALDGWLRLYIEMQIEGIKSARTTECVRRDLVKFEAFFLSYVGDKNITRWLPRVSQRFIEHLQEKGFRPATIMRTIASLRACAKWIYSKRPDFFPLGNPTAGSKPPVQDALRPKALTAKQSKLLLDAAFHLITKNYPAQELHADDWRTRSFKTIRRPIRDYAILMLLLNAGIRREEVCNIDLKQIQGRKLIGIKCKGNIYRDLLLGTDTEQALLRYIKEERVADAQAFGDSQSLFLPSRSRQRGPGNARLSVQAINRIIDYIANEANAHIPEPERFRVNPHMFRHTHAYNLLEKGKDLSFVQKRLGHQSMTYLVRYTQMPEEQELQLLNVIEMS